MYMHSQEEVKTDKTDEIDKNPWMCYRENMLQSSIENEAKYESIFILTEVEHNE